MLTDLDKAVRKSGLRVIELEGWRTNRSGGDSTYGPGGGVSTHHTGSYDDVGDTSSDLAYAKWMAFVGRSDLDPPLCNLALSAECVVYVCAAGNANGVGEAKAVGPMPHFSDGNAFYIVIEAMNSGSQGWNRVGRDADGNPITQYDAYVALCGALCVHYDWEPSHIRGHWETSVTGKWDPGDPRSGAGPEGKSMDMNRFRAAVARWIAKKEDPKEESDIDARFDALFGHLGVDPDEDDPIP
jgi:hypothetical protein